MKEVYKEQAKTLMEKSKQPAINPRQLAIFVIVQIIGAIQGMIPLIIGEDFNAAWFMSQMILDNVSYFLIMSLRSVAPEEVPDTTAGKLAEQLMKGLIDILAKRDLSADIKQKDLLMDKLEYHVQWTMREWNTIYEERFAEAKAYYNEKLKEVNDLLENTP